MQSCVGSGWITSPEWKKEEVPKEEMQHVGASDREHRWPVRCPSSPGILGRKEGRLKERAWSLVKRRNGASERASERETRAHFMSLALHARPNGPSPFLRPFGVNRTSNEKPASLDRWLLRLLPIWIPEARDRRGGGTDPQSRSLISGENIKEQLMQKDLVPAAAVTDNAVSRSRNVHDQKFEDGSLNLQQSLPGFEMWTLRVTNVDCNLVSPLAPRR